MAQVTVSPETFELIDFDAAEVAAVAASVADAVGLADDVKVQINIDEAIIMAKSSSRLESPPAGAEAGQSTVIVEATGGAFESLRKARTFDETRCRNVLGQALLRARDRLDPAFGDPPADGDLDVHQETAWATSIEGRLHRSGVISGRPQRRIYHFRVRHGFNDTVDRVFDRLWNTDGLTWSDIQAASDEARGATVSS
jgi:hypothetical protein